MSKIILLLTLFASLSALAKTVSSIGLTWTKAESHKDTTTFAVLIGPSPGQYSTRHEAGTATTTLVDLEPGTYYLAVVANDGGLDSLPSNEITCTVPTGEPVELVSNFTIVRTAQSALLRWNRNATNQLVFQYEINFRKASEATGFSVMSTGTEATIPMDLESTYFVDIRAIGAAGAGPWLTRSVPGLVRPSSVLLSRNGSVQYRWQP
jgi:hypothetical protein